MSECMCVYLVPVEARRGPQIPWNWSYSQLGATMWVLGTQPWSNARAVRALDCGTISPSPRCVCVKLCHSFHSRHLSVAKIAAMHFVFTQEKN